MFAGPTALSQLWLFIVAPLVGAALAFGVQRVLLLGPTSASKSAERAPAGAPAD